MAKKNSRLSLITWILILIGGIVILAYGPLLNIVLGIIIIVAAILIRRNQSASQVRNWSIIGIICSIAGFLLGYGLFVGPVISLAGSILALLNKK